MAHKRWFTTVAPSIGLLLVVVLTLSLPLVGAATPATLGNTAVLVKDINTLPAPSNLKGSSPSEFVTIDSTTYFAASDGNNGNETATPSRSFLAPLYSFQE